MKLAARIVLLCLIAMATMSGLFSFLTIQRDARYFAEEHSRTAAELVEAIKPQITEAWSDGGDHGLAEAVKACSIEFRQVSMRYVRFDHSDSELKPEAPEHLWETVFEHEKLTVTATDKEGHKKVLTYIPLGEDKSSGVEVARSMQEAEAHAHRTLWTSLLALSGAALLCAGIIVFGGIHMIGRPLNRLVEKTKRIGKGDFTNPIHVGGSTELSQLAAALNEMCDQLAEQQALIEAESNSRVRAEQQLRHADRLKTVGRLAAGIAHEMGTPLNVISGRAGLIATGKLSDNEIRESAATIKAQADRITRIIRSLLDFARRDQPNRALGDVKSIVEVAVELLRTFAEKKNVAIQVGCQPGSFYALVDAGQLQQVFANLIMNAVQSIDDSGTIDIQLSHERAVPPDGVESNHGDYVRIDVQDTGSGIAPEDQENIFEPFFTTKEVGVGTGLGLSISHGIIRDHEGWITVDSEPRVGSCFSVFIPSAAPTQTS